MSVDDSYCRLSEHCGILKHFTSSFLLTLFTIAELENFDFDLFIDCDLDPGKEKAEWSNNFQVYVDSIFSHTFYI